MFSGRGHVLKLRSSFESVVKLCGVWTADGARFLSLPATNRTTSACGAIEMQSILLHVEIRRAE
jgi:hypothetical protein